MNELISVDTESIVYQATQVLKNFPQIAGAYLFGSALGKCRHDSDIDIGLILEDIKIGERERAILEADISNSFSPFNGHPYNITLFDLNNTIFCFRVIKEGRLIYVRNPDRVTDVMEDVSRRYADVYPRYKIALEEILSEVMSDVDRT